MFREEMQTFAFVHEAFVFLNRRESSFVRVSESLQENSGSIFSISGSLTSILRHDVQVNRYLVTCC